MIATHRRRHRWIFWLLALALPLLVALALRARPAPPLQDALPAAASPFADDTR